MKGKKVMKGKCMKGKGRTGIMLSVAAVVAAMVLCMGCNGEGQTSGTAGGAAETADTEAEITETADTEAEITEAEVDGEVDEEAAGIAEEETGTAEGESGQEEATQLAGATYSRIDYNGDSYQIARSEYEYDEQGNQIKHTMYWENSDGEEDVCWGDFGQITGITGIRSWTAEYDEQGNQIKYTIYDYDGNVCWGDDYDDSWTAEYDEQGNMIKQTNYDEEDGSVSWWYEYEYNEQGNPIKQTTYYEYESGIEWWYEYEYDEQGNQIKLVMRNNLGRDDVLSTYEYDEQGNLIKEIWYVDAYIQVEEGSVSTWKEYEYDEQGNRIKETYYVVDYEQDDNGEWYPDDEKAEQWCEYEYDVYGKLIRETRHVMEIYYIDDEETEEEAIYLIEYEYR